MPAAFNILAVSASIPSSGAANASLTVNRFPSTWGSSSW
jgi:hypothetical protein